jgi:diguanylate cyclase (GGDEF)-like protein
LRASAAEIQVPDLPVVTISIGVAQHQSEETTESLLRRADTALYQAKAAGRNRVVVT